MELEQCRGELAAANVRLSGTETQLKKSRKEEKHLKSNLKQSAVRNASISASTLPQGDLLLH